MSAQPTHDVVPVPLPSRPRIVAAQGPPGSVSRVRRRTVPAVPPPLPRTSLERPWDRVRFAAEHRPGAEMFEDGPAPGRDEEPPRADEADLERLAAGIVQHAVEALLGTRSPAQLARWLAPPLYESLSRRAGLAGRLQGRPDRFTHVVVRRTIGSTPSERAREVSVVVHDGTKVRAAAVRIEVFRGRWRAVALEIG
ncbi:Rv3235 family protein [Georgenia sp. Z1491]|uniref:Rv3235 family protein n=1 Tax=Georgenia sp. Z1491 TaxID=3416707 RepID=UPI003CEEC34A